MSPMLQRFFAGLVRPRSIAASELATVLPTLWSIVFVITSVFCINLSAVAENISKDASNAAERSADSQDLLLLGPLEPTRLRIKITVDGEPFRAAWLDTFNRIFESWLGQRRAA